MNAEKSDVLGHVYPLDTLRPETREQLCSEAAFSDYTRGEAVFRAGDIDDYTIYLLDGEVSAEYPDGKTRQFIGKSLQGRYALGESQPRRFTATVTTPHARVARLDRRYMEKVIAWDQIARSAATDADDGGADANRWVFRLLQSRAFHKLPTGNIERMFQGLEELPVRAGDTIVREGDEGDYFYVIKEGAASVHKHLDDTESIVAYLVRGDCFGEDALLANTTRNATVKMMQDGRVMRLSRATFENVLKPPVVEWLNPTQASLLARTGAVVIDVRLPAEFEQRAIRDAVNIPLHRLREEAVDRFSKDDKLIVYCNTGERSSAAAFILTRLGFNAYALQGGLLGMLRQQERQQET